MGSCTDPIGSKSPAPADLRNYADDADQHGNHWVPIAPASLRGIADELERLSAAYRYSEAHAMRLLTERDTLRTALRAMLDDDDHDAAKNTARAALAGLGGGAQQLFEHKGECNGRRHAET